MVKGKSTQRCNLSCDIWKNCVNSEVSLIQSKDDNLLTLVGSDMCGSFLTVWDEYQASLSALCKTVDVFKKTKSNISWIVTNECGTINKKKNNLFKTFLLQIELQYDSNWNKPAKERKQPYTKLYWM